MRAPPPHTPPTPTPLAHARCARLVAVAPASSAAEVGARWRGAPRLRRRGGAVAHGDGKQRAVYMNAMADVAERRRDELG